MKLTKSETIEKLRQGYDLVSKKYPQESEYYTLEKGEEKIYNLNKSICRGLINDLHMYHTEVDQHLCRVIHFSLMRYENIGLEVRRISPKYFIIWDLRLDMPYCNEKFWLSHSAIEFILQNFNTIRK